MKGNRIVIQRQTYTCIYFHLCLEILNNNDYTVIWRVYPLLFVPALTFWFSLDRLLVILLVTSALALQNSYFLLCCFISLPEDFS